MAKNILIAQIGLGNNLQTTTYRKFNRHEDHRFYYPDNDEGVECEFSFYVIYQDLMKAHQKVDTLLLVGTASSGWKGVCEFFAKKSGRDVGCLGISDEKILDMDEEVQGSIERFLEKCLDGTEVRLVIQHSGVIPEESKENLHCLQETISDIMNGGGAGTGGNEAIHLHLDISNGFRSFPVYVFLCLHYTAQMHPEDEIRLFMYYGMFDRKMSEEPGPDGEPSRFVSDRNGKNTPMVDMGNATELMEWSNAVVEFYNNGSVTQIRKLLKSHRGWADIVAGTGKEDTLSKVFEEFDFAMNSNNLKLLEESIGKIGCIGSCLPEDLPDYVAILLKQISADFRSRFKGGGNTQAKYGILSFQIARWYYDQGRMNDAAIAMQEGMITYIMEMYPQECATLINKKDRTSEQDGDAIRREEALFDFNNREIIRENVLDTRDMEGAEWLSEYKYICDNLRDPAMQMQYNAFDKTALEVDMDAARRQIGRLIRKMLGDELAGDIAGCLKKLNEMEDYDLFISYRRTYKEYEDGVAIVRSLAEYLEGQQYIDVNGNSHNYKVFWDKEGLEGLAGEYGQEIRNAIRNSEYVLVVLGQGALDREYNEADWYYKEILTAKDLKYPKEIFVINMDGFTEPEGFEAFPDEIKGIVQRYQWIGGRGGWKETELDELKEQLFLEIQKNREGKIHKKLEAQRKSRK